MTRNPYYDANFTKITTFIFSSMIPYATNNGVRMPMGHRIGLRNCSTCLTTSQPPKTKLVSHISETIKSKKKAYATRKPTFFPI